MLFTSVSFLWFFLPIVFVGNFILKNNTRNYFMLLLSCVFYAWGEPKHLWLMVFSIIFNYLFGLAIAKFKNKEIWIFLGVISNLLFLGYYKYFNFAIESLGRFSGKIDEGLFQKVALPIGISFYTFQALSYLIDLYRGKFDVQKNVFKLGLYISLFPQLIAGPIVQYNDVASEIDNRTITYLDVSYGIKRFIYGLSKKMIFSNAFALIADSIFNLQIEYMTSACAWLGAIAYALQIYYDFSGYSDMAIGLGRILGFHFLENFNYPYISSSVTEFWRRWHISLSSWFKNYVYIPLGGNRKGKTRTFINLMVVFLLTGFWHGAAWQFIAWGAYYGLFLIVERIFLPKQEFKGFKKVILHIYTLLVVLFGWVLFRSPGLRYSIKYIALMLFPFLQGDAFTATFFLDFRNIILFVGGFLLCGPVQMAFPKIKQALFNEDNISYKEIVVLVVLFMYNIVLLVSNTYNPFIYFRF